MNMTVGRIEFGNTREGNALSVLQDALMDKSMWMMEAMRKDEEIDRLKKLLEKKGDKYANRKKISRKK